MNLISLLFKSKPSSQVDTLDNAVTTPPAELFVETTPPPSMSGQPSQRSIISDFMSRDFQGAGARDGYNFHSSEILESRKKEIRSSFIFELDLAIAQVNEKSLRLNHLIIDMAGVSEDMKEKLGSTISKMDEDVITLSLQKELAGMDEGWVMGPIRKYHVGFIQGMQEYVETEALLGTSIF